MVLGLHYVSDVLAGAILGTLVGVATVMVLGVKRIVPASHDLPPRWRWLRPLRDPTAPRPDRPPADDEDDEDLLGYGDDDDEPGSGGEDPD